MGHPERFLLQSFSVPYFTFNIGANKWLNRQVRENMPCSLNTLLHYSPLPHNSYRYSWYIGSNACTYYKKFIEQGSIALNDLWDG